MRREVSASCLDFYHKHVQTVRRNLTIQLLPQLKIFLAYQPVDFRKGIDGLVSLCRNQLQADPYDGSGGVR
jgi:hypothetical protein